jgi:hypothetical protein
MAKYSSDKDVNNLIKSLVKKGWTVKFSKHLKLYSPDGQMISCSFSPSCPFAVRKIEADIRRYSKKKEAV